MQMNSKSSLPRNGFAWRSVDAIKSKTVSL